MARKSTKAATSAAAQTPMATMPDSLDLVQHARLGINGLAGTTDPERQYEPYFLSFYAAQPAYQIHWSGLISGVLPKYIEAYALLRCMSGCTDHKDAEDGMIAGALENIADDGLIYDCKRPDRPWNINVGIYQSKLDVDYANMAGNGRLVCAMDFYYQLTGDEAWKKRMKRTADRMAELAVRKGELAYYPNVGTANDFSYVRNTPWAHTDEPKGPQEGNEGATTFYMAQPIRGFTRWYKYSGDERMLSLSKGMVKVALQSKYWGGVNDVDPVYGAARGRWWAHFHANTAALRGLLEYAIVAEDWHLKQFVRDAYECGRQNLCPELGMTGGIEGCVAADWTALGIQLSDGGVGDYWDDVDACMRNFVAAIQVQDIDALRRLSASGPQRPKNSVWGAIGEERFHNGVLMPSLPGMECNENVLERNIGAICNHPDGAGRFQSPWQMACCTGNGNQAFYYAWEAVVRADGDTANVNLFFNRFSPWLDVQSHLPYEGKVVLSNKTMRKINVRIPGWVKRSTLRVKLGGKDVQPTWIGAYISIDGLKPGQQITLQFFVETQTRSLYMPALFHRPFHGTPRLEATFKGSTCIHFATPDAGSPEGKSSLVPMFNREKYLANKAPMKSVEAYVPPRLIRWY